MKYRKDFRDAVPETPAHFVRAMDETLERIENMKAKRHYARKLVLVALAAVLLIGGAFAAENWNLFRTMTDMAEPIEPLPGAEGLIETDLTRVENEYVTVEVIEALYDGQTAMAALRIAAKNPEEYVPFHAFLQDVPEEEYITGLSPVLCAEGRQAVVMDEVEYEIVNEPGAMQLFVNGVEVEIPASEAEAIEQNLPVYLADGALYSANQWDYQVIGRRDGRKLLGYSIDLTCVETGEEWNWSMAEAQPDGSVILWMERELSVVGNDGILIALSGSVTANDETIALPDEEFALTNAAEIHTVAYLPGDELDRVRILSVEFSMTKVKGYMTVVYAYLPEESEQMGLSFLLADGAGNPIPTGSGWMEEEPGEDGWVIVTERVETQSFENDPAEFQLSFKVVGQDKALGSIPVKNTEIP